jgi:hypothetical protein
LIGLLDQLADNPSQIGDYFEPDESGREVQFILVRDLLIAFWADHAVRELRIVDIEEVSPASSPASSATRSASACKLEISFSNSSCCAVSMVSITAASFSALLMPYSRTSMEFSR